jgi:hypothetical protein
MIESRQHRHKPHFVELDQQQPPEVRRSPTKEHSLDDKRGIDARVVGVLTNYRNAAATRYSEKGFSESLAAV